LEDNLDVKEAVRRQFAPVAVNYAASAVHAGGPDLRAMLAAVPLSGDERALDIGCGPGHTALAFAPRVREVVAVDLTEDMLTQGRRLAGERGIGNAVFQRGDVEDLPFPDGSFDLVTSRYSAHHYPHPLVALREVARVLKPGGTLLLVDVVAPDDPVVDAFLNHIETLRDPSHVRDHTIMQWTDMLTIAGLTTEVVGIWPLRLEFASWVTRMNTPPAAVAAIRALRDGAAPETRAALAVEEDYSFTVQVALLKGANSCQPSAVS